MNSMMGSSRTEKGSRRGAGMHRRVPRSVQRAGIAACIRAWVVCSGECIFWEWPWRMEFFFARKGRKSWTHAINENGDLSTFIAVHLIPRAHTSSTVSHVPYSSIQTVLQYSHPKPDPPSSAQHGSTMCHSSHVMRHCGYRHFKPSKHTADGHETRSTDFSIHAFFLFCRFLASMHWAWVRYGKARRHSAKGS